MVFVTLCNIQIYTLQVLCTVWWHLKICGSGFDHIGQNKGTRREFLCDNCGGVYVIYLVFNLIGLITNILLRCK